ncbi:MAG: O-antigen ligase family protein [Actinomycetota bacterium]|nr:O-antigen ligase family protein [Actinomycetota bacterium]
MRLARSTGPLDIGLALGLGGFAALLVTSLPMIVALFFAVALVALATTTRFDVGQVGSSLVLLTSFTIPMNRLFPGAIPIPASDFFLVAAVGVYLLMRLVEQRSSEEQTYRTIFIALGVISLGGLVGALFETAGPFMYKALGVPNRDVSGWGPNLGNLMKFILGSFLPMALWALVRPNRKFMVRIVNAFFAGCTFSALIGLTLPYGRGGARAIGVTVHPNQFGSLSLMGIGAGLGLLLSGRLRPWALPAFPILALGILQSGSRAALGGLAVLALIVGPMTRDRRVFGGLALGLAAVLMVFATGVIQPSGEDALGRTFGDSSTAVGSGAIRDDLAERVFDRWQERPVTGQGFNYMRPSHNVYLGLITSAGVLGVLGFAVLVGAIVRRVWRQRDDMLTLGVAAGYFAYLANAYFDNIFWWRWLWFYVGLVVAVTATAERRKADAAEADAAEADAQAEELLRPAPTDVGASSTR